MPADGGAAAAQQQPKEEEERPVFDPRDVQIQSRASYGPGFGPVATSRAVHHPEQDPSANSLADFLHAKDSALVTEEVTRTLTYQPVTVAGFDLKLEPLSPSIGTVIHGCDLTAVPNTPELVDFLRLLWLDRRVICFRSEHVMSREEHANFVRCFGEVGGVFGEIGAGNDPPEADGFARFHAKTVRGAGAASNWHSDASWAPRPPMGSVLLCRTPAPTGGDTLFCDSYACWAALPPATRQRLSQLTATHASFFAGPDDKDTVSVHPCARTHPETGGTALWVTPFSLGGFTTEIHADDEEEANELMRQCEKVTGRAEYTCRFRWEEGSVAMW